VARKEGTDCVIDLKKKHGRHLEVRINPDIIIVKIKRDSIQRALSQPPRAFTLN
jgi:hypothetical protein